MNSSMTELNQKTQAIKDIQEQHYASTTPMGEYFQGMYNGLELALSILTSNDANFKDVEKRPESELEKIKKICNQHPYCKKDDLICPFEDISLKHGCLLYLHPTKWDLDKINNIIEHFGTPTSALEGEKG